VTGGAGSIAFSSNGENLAPAHLLNQKNLSNVATGELQTQIKTDTVIFTSIAFSPDGKMLAGVGG
jgi:WD40 repeat protein